MAGETILVVDDSPTIQKVVSRNLRRAGYRVELAGDGQEGLEVAQRANPQMILLDFVMPRMNGFQFCRALREIDNLARIPIVLMSAKGDKIGSKFIQQVGAVDSITKPFSPEALLAVSSHVLAKYRDGAADSLDLPRFTSLDMSLLEENEEEDEPDTKPRWDRLSLEESRQAREVADEIAGRMVDILISTLPELGHMGDEIEEALARRLTPKALEVLSQSIAKLEPSAGKAAFAGDMASVPLPEVIQLLDLQSQTGCLEIRRDNFRVLTFFRKGRIELAMARGGRDEFLLGRYLIEEEVIGRTELELLIRNHAPDEGLLGQQLISRGYMTEEDLRRVLERQTCELIYEVLRWGRGHYAFRPGVSTRESEMARLGLTAAAILMEGFRRVDEWRLIEREIEDFDVTFQHDEAAIERFGRDQLTQDERVVLDAVDGRSNIREIVTRTKMGSFLASKLLYRLLSVKLIQKRE
jgi:DNA-binding response OmpR family regulator